LDTSNDWGNKFREFLDKVGSKIPMYNAYREREFRRQDDKLLREMLVKKLDRVKSEMQEAMKDTANLMIAKDLEPVFKELQAFQDRLRYAPYGYSGFFDRDNIDIPQLEKIYKFDRSLVEGIENLEGMADALSSDQMEKKESLAIFASKLSELDRALDDRRKFLEV
jgi:hypothetical protein